MAGSFGWSCSDRRSILAAAKYRTGCRVFPPLNIDKLATARIVRTTGLFDNMASATPFGKCAAGSGDRLYSLLAPHK